MISTSLKTKIDHIWQTFYNYGVSDPNTIVNQVSVFLLLKYLDSKQTAQERRAAALGLPLEDRELVYKAGNYVDEAEGINIPYEKLRWRTFKNMSGEEMLRTMRDCVYPFITKLNSKEEGPFAKLMGDITLSITKPSLLVQIIDCLDDHEIDVNSDDTNIGEMYEHILTTAKISGQYMTPRHIIKLMVEMVDPKLGQRIADPACGTGGFLIGAAQHIMENQAEEMLDSRKRKFFSESAFLGRDTDTTMARISAMNMMLHGVKNPDIDFNSLLDKGEADRYYNSFDTILANPPFSGSLPYEDVDGKIIASVKTKATELLFIALYLKLLKVGGYCASVVPEGVLFRNNSAYATIHKELIDKQRLIAIVSLPAGLFVRSGKTSTSGVKTSFIVFQKADYRRPPEGNVWFYEMKNDGFSFGTNRTPIEGSQIPDCLARYKILEAEAGRTRKDCSFLVPYSEIREHGYSLDIKDYRETEHVTVDYRPKEEILADIESSLEEETALLAELREMLGAEE